MEAVKETKAKDDGPIGPDGKKLKPCCACPETKRPRDACIMEKVFWCCNAIFLYIIYLLVRVRRTAANWLRLTRLACVLLVSRSKRLNSERLDKKGDLSDIQNTQVIPKRFSLFLKMNFLAKISLQQLSQGVGKLPQRLTPLCKHLPAAGFHSGRTAFGTFEPDYLYTEGSTIPTYPPLNIQVWRFFSLQ